MSHARSALRGGILRATLLAIAGTGCGRGAGTALEQLTEVRRLSTETLAEFLHSVDASSRAVMAGLDEESASYAEEARAASDAVQSTLEEIRPLLESLGYSDELRIAEEFAQRFAEYRALDQSVLQLAVENTNLKAQRLAFGPALAAAEEFRAALESLVPSAQETSACQVQLILANAVAAMRGMQVLQAPHIAEPQDAEMVRLEQEMAALEATIRAALEELVPLLPSDAESRLAPAQATLDAFLALHGEILALSRRNTNVHSLALTMGQKRMLAASCEDGLRALQSALAKRELGSRR